MCPFPPLQPQQHRHTVDQVFFVLTDIDLQSENSFRQETNNCWVHMHTHTHPLVERNAMLGSVSLCRMGVTSPMTGFACAMTQFLEAWDVQVLARVSRLDLRTTEQLWDTSVALLTEANMVDERPGSGTRTVTRTGTCFGVLHKVGGSNPVCYAYATRRVQQAIRSTFFPVRQDTFHHRAPKSSLHDSVSLGIFLDSTQKPRGAFAEMGITNAGSLFRTCPWSNGLGQWFINETWVEPLKNGTVFDSHRNLSARVQVLFEFLVSRGTWIEYVAVHTSEDAASIITFWFGMGVAPHLTLFCRGEYLKLCIEATPECQRFQPALIVV